MLLVIFTVPIVFEPVYESLEWCMVFFVEMEAFWSYLDKLFDNFLSGNICKYYVLRVNWKNREPVRNTARLLFLFFFHTLLKFFKCLSVQEFCMTCHFSYQSVARYDVSFDDLTQIFELVVTDQQFLANCSTLWFILLNDINMDKVLLEELPCKSDVVFTSS